MSSVAALRKEVINSKTVSWKFYEEGIHTSSENGEMR
jgi:hypothetical protein